MDETTAAAMLKAIRILALVLVLGGVAAPAAAEVTVTFHAHAGNQIRGGWLLFPHAFLTLKGTLDETGEAVDEAVGFTAKNPGPQLLFMSGRGVVAEPDARYRDEANAYLSLAISDETYRALQARLAYWRSREGSTYNLRRRNCIHFIAEMARTVGLRTPPEDTLSPNGFLAEMAGMNEGVEAEPASPDPADAVAALGS